MIKTLMTWALLSPTITANPILTTIQNHDLKAYGELKDGEYVSSFINVDHTYKSSTGPKSGENDLFIHGINRETHYRVYIDSGNDSSLPKSPVLETNDYVRTKVKKNDWYNHLIKGLSIDVSNYEGSKSQFLNKYKAVSFSYVYNYNFWNTRDGWSHDFGKSTALVTAVKTYPLFDGNSETTIFEKSESSHANNEKAKLVLKREWDGNILKYNFYLSVLVNWKDASPYKHAAFASFMSHNFTFISVPPTEFPKSTKMLSLDQESELVLDTYNSIDLKKLDSKLSIKAKEEDINKSAYKTVSNFTFGYYGVKKFNQKNYILSIHVNILGYPIKDSSLILNDVIRERKLWETFTPNGLNFNYENSIGQKGSLSALKLDELYLGISLKGMLYAPILYII